MNKKNFGKKSLRVLQKTKPSYLPPQAILEKQGRKARRTYASCSMEFNAYMTCANRVGATKMSCFTQILKLSRCLDYEKRNSSPHKSSMPYHIKNLYNGRKKK